MNLIILTLIGVVAILGVLLTQRRNKSVESLALKIGFQALPTDQIEHILGKAYTKTFLHAKGDKFIVPSFFHHKGAIGKEYLLDWQFSSSGNEHIMFQRVLFVWELKIDSIPPFVVESLNPLERVSQEDLLEAGFHALSPNLKTYFKTPDPSGLDQMMGQIIRILLRNYPKLCLEYHQGFLFAYQNQSKAIGEGSEIFYRDLRRELLEMHGRGPKA
ncbi:MAG: hypothetical protein AAFY71_11315 [Bacteroidota bacterium]